MSTVVLDLQERLLALVFSLPEIGGDGDPGSSSADTPIVSGDGADDAGICAGARLHRCRGRRPQPLRISSNMWDRSRLSASARLSRPNKCCSVKFRLMSGLARGLQAARSEPGELSPVVPEGAGSSKGPASAVGFNHCWRHFVAWTNSISAGSNGKSLFALFYPDLTCIFHELPPRLKRTVN